MKTHLRFVLSHVKLAETQKKKNNDLSSCITDFTAEARDRRGGTYDIIGNSLYTIILLLCLCSTFL